MTSLILVDVDGVLNPNTPSTDFIRYEIPVMGSVYKVNLNMLHAEWLTNLAFETNSQLVWCTYWENNAPMLLAPILGLPDMPVIPMKLWKMGVSLGAEKAYSAKQYVGDSKFVYFDDEWDIGLHLTNTNGWHIWIDPDDGLQQKHIDLAKDYLNKAE